MANDLHNKRVLVTGATGGIGSEMVRAFGRAGAMIAVNHVNADDAAEALVIKIGRNRAFAVDADVSDDRQVDAMFEEVEARWGGVDVLVNNAGIELDAGPAWHLSPDDWRKVLAVNLTGPFLCCRRALPAMVGRASGVILNVTSVHETIPWSGHSAYTTSKAGLAMLTRTLAQEASPFGVRILNLAPGAIRTPINANVWQSEEGLADLRKKIPLGRIGEPKEVAALAVMLCSDVASYVSGTTIFVDGGMTDYPSFRHGG